MATFNRLNPLRALWRQGRDQRVHRVALDNCTDDATPLRFLIWRKLLTAIFADIGVVRRHWSTRNCQRQFRGVVFAGCVKAPAVWPVTMGT